MLPYWIIFFIGLIYLDFAIYYNAEMDDIWLKKKHRFRGLLCRLWDALS